mgnify:CR=1
MKVTHDHHNAYELSSASTGSHHSQPTAHHRQKRLGSDSAHLHKYAHEMPKQRQFLDAGLYNLSRG